jgi:hypothetical protein
LLVDGEGDIHFHSIRGHILCVNSRATRRIAPAGGDSCRSRPVVGKLCLSAELPHSSEHRA